MFPIVLDFPDKIQWSDDELFEFCVANRDLVVERNTLGQLIIMSPTGGNSSSSNAEISAEFVVWNRKVKLGKVFDSSGGFRLREGSVRAPDVAWVSNDRWNALSNEEKEKFPPICPDFVLELRSRTDALQTLKEKMNEWINNGCRLAWLIDPIEENIYIYYPNKEPQLISDFSQILEGEEVLAGFSLDLSILSSSMK